MHRIDTPGATPDNRFTEGDPTIPTAATEVSAEWLNAVQEEVAAVIAGAGIALDKADNGQLLEAIKKLGPERFKGFATSGQHEAWEADLAAIARNSLYAVRKGTATGLPQDMPADMPAEAWAFVHTMVMPGDAARTQLLWSVDDPDHPGWWRRRAAGAWGEWKGVGGNTDNTAALRDMQAGTVRLWPSLTIPVLADGLPLGLPLDGAIASLTTYPRLARVLCPAGDNAWAPAWYRCTAGGVRDVAGGHIRLDDWRGGFPQVLDAGAGRAKSTVLVSTTSGSATITIVNNLSAGGTLTTPYTGSDGIYPGLAVSGTGIPAGATVVSVAGTTVTLSASCTATGANVEATITGRVLGSWQSDAGRNMQGYAQFLSGIARTSSGVFTLSAPAGGGLSAGLMGSVDARFTFNSALVVPTAPTSRPAGPVCNAIILV